MSYNFIKKNKSRIYYFIISFIVLTIFNYIIQINYVDKIYKVNLSLKKIDTFSINKSFYKMENNKKELLQLAGRTLEKYERSYSLECRKK